jgi:hypothetical protein
MLPLPVTVAGGLSMEHHMSLALCRGGSGSLDHLGVPARVVYMAWLMERSTNRSTPDAAPFHAANAALERRLQRSSDGWRLDVSEAACIAPLLAMHDSQLAHLPRSCYSQAWTALVKAVGSDRLPLPPDATSNTSRALVRLLSECEAAT